MGSRAHIIGGKAVAAGLLLLLTSSCSPLQVKVRVHDSAGLSREDRDAVTAHARSGEESTVERLREDARSEGAPWRKRCLYLNVTGDRQRIHVNGSYQVGDMFRGGPRFDGVRTKDGWRFLPAVINPC
jgi:hypothetical protein